MTNKTQIAELAQNIIEQVADYGAASQESFDLAMKATITLLQPVFNQHEAAEARIAEITEQYVDRTTALSFSTQRAEKAEAELAALRGAAVPMAENIPCPSAPDFVWLQTNGDDSDESSWPINNPDKVTWCVDKIFRNDTLYVRSELSTHAQPMPLAVADADIVRDANRYRFLRDSDSWGEDSDTWDPDTQTGLISSSNLITLETGSFDAAVDARMAASDIPFYNPAQPAPVVVLPTTYWTFDDDKNPVFDADEVIAALEKAGITVKYADGEGE